MTSPTTATRQATRTDPATGIQEIAGFFGPGPMKIFGFTHLPPAGAEAGVVVCSPLYAEFVRNYRREVLIGRRLASAGIAVQRFHYRGHGNSDGAIGEATFETMREDALAAAERLIETAGVTRLAFFGTRFGALLAAATARRFEGSPLVLWDPVPDPAQYLRDIFRASRIQALKQGGRASASGDGMLEQLQRQGAAHVLGYTISRSLYESGRGHTLEGEIGASPRRMLLVQLGQDPRVSRTVTQLVTRLAEGGFAVESRAIGRQEAWWFTAGALVIQEALTEPVDVSVDWLTRTLAAPPGAR